MVINSWISRIILGAWHMRNMKIIIMKTTASESSFFLRKSFFFCLFWFELPRWSVTGDVVARTDAASTKVSSFSKHSCVSTSGLVSLVGGHNAVQGPRSLFLLPILVFDWCCCCCFLAFFTEQFVFLRDLVDCPENSYICLSCAYLKHVLFCWTTNYEKRLQEALSALWPYK